MTLSHPSGVAGGPEGVVALQAPVFSPLIKPGKNAENADSVSQPPRVSVLLYPHIIREELTMASKLEERAVRQWLATTAGVAGVGEGSGRQRRSKLVAFVHFFQNSAWIFRGRKKKLGVGGTVVTCIRIRACIHTRTHA